MKKISYERRNYESVDGKSLSKAVSKNYEKKNSGTKGLNNLASLEYRSTVKIT